MVLWLEMEQRWHELTWDARLALLMFISSGSRRLRLLIRKPETILFAQMSLRGSAPIMDTALTILTTS